MEAYIVSVTRSCTKEYEVEAENPNEVNKKALELAMNDNWSSEEAEYSIEL